MLTPSTKGIDKVWVSVSYSVCAEGAYTQRDRPRIYALISCTKPLDTHTLSAYACAAQHDAQAREVPMTASINDRIENMKAATPKYILDPESGRMVKIDKSGRKMPRKIAAQRAAAIIASHPAREWDTEVPF